MNYKYIFFDLDHTLWDYEANSKWTLFALYDQYNLQNWGITTPQHFYEAFRDVNYILWDRYDRGEIGVDYLRGERFHWVLKKFNRQSEQLASTLSLAYLSHCPKGNHLIPYAYETLEYLKSRYRLTIITNGFDDTQFKKMESGKLTPFFDHVVTSQRAGCKKPERAIFEYALNVNGALCHEAIMIGDNLNTDIEGSKNAQIDHVFFNPDNNPHTATLKYEIKCLKELCDFL